MKKLLIWGILLLSAGFCFADSPLTSTVFYNSYRDIPIILSAEKTAVMTKEYADYLHSDKNSIDKKAALINAIGWSNAGTADASKYCEEIFGRQMTEADLSSLNSDDAFVIGYLKALDNYHDPQGALPFLKAARKGNPESFTVAMIYALTRAQIIMSKDMCKVWKYAEKVFTNEDLKKDMREAGRSHIYDYVVLYKPDCSSN